MLGLSRHRPLLVAAASNSLSPLEMNVMHVLIPGFHDQKLEINGAQRANT